MAPAHGRQAPAFAAGSQLRRDLASCGRDRHGRTEAELNGTRHDAKRGLAVNCTIALLCAAGCGGGKGATADSAPAPSANVVATPRAAGDTWVDPQYAPDRTTLASLAIAPIPSAGENAAQLDEALERVFLDTPGSQLRAQPHFVRQAMNGNRPFLLEVERIRAARYTPSDLPAANLNQILDPRQLVGLRTTLRSAAMLVLPLEFEVAPRGKVTEGHVAYRVYSLDSGRLLLQNRLGVRVEEGGDAGRRETTIRLLLAMQKDFADRLMPQ